MTPRSTYIQDMIRDLLSQAEFEALIRNCRLELREARQTNDRYAEGLVYIGLADAYQYLGQFQDARILADGALEIGKDIDEPRLMIEALNLSGTIHLNGTYQSYEAEADFRTALRLAHDSDDLPGTIRALKGIGGAYNSIEQAEKGQRYAREAFEIARDINDVEMMIDALRVVGDALYDQQKFEQAQKCYADALALTEQDGLRLYEGLLVGNIGLLRTRSDSHYDEGLRLLKRALRLSQEINCAPHEFQTLYWLGGARMQRNDYTGALDYYETMLQRAQAWRNPAYEATAFYIIGMLRYREERYTDAISEYQQAAAISRDTMNPYREAQAEHAIAASYYADKRYDDALKHFMTARTLYDALDNMPKVRDMTFSILMAYARRFVASVLRMFGLDSGSDDT